MRIGGIGTKLEAGSNLYVREVLGFREGMVYG
jgi:hypothetical protein